MTPAFFLRGFVIGFSIAAPVGPIAGLGLGAAPGYGSAAAVVAGVFSGSAAWWLLLSGGVALARARIGDAWLRLVNHVSGAMIFAFGVYAIVHVFRR